MIHSINLGDAAHILQAHFGPRFPASQAGGEHRLVARVREQFELNEQEAAQVVAALVRRRAIRWVAEPSLSRPCPGILELCGDWIIQPERLVG